MGIFLTFVSFICNIERNTCRVTLSFSLSLPLSLILSFFPCLCLSFLLLLSRLGAQATPWLAEVWAPNQIFCFEKVFFHTAWTRTAAPVIWTQSGPRAMWSFVPARDRPDRLAARRRQLFRISVSLPFATAG